MQGRCRVFDPRQVHHGQRLLTLISNSMVFNDFNKIVAVFIHGHNSPGQRCV